MNGTHTPRPARPRARRRRAGSAGAMLLAALVAFPLAGAAGDADRRQRLESMRAEIVRLRGELESLSRRERSVLGEIERLGAELRLREAELAETSVRIEQITDEIAGLDVDIEDLSQAQEQRRRYLSFRLREMYKRGPTRELRRLVGGDEVRGYLEGLRYAGYLSERDARVLDEYRADRRRLESDRSRLAAERAHLATARDEARRAREALARSRTARERLLEDLHRDRRRREAAVHELARAAEDLSGLIERLGEREAVEPVVDVRKFRGLLDWPADGPVGAGFGNVVHPRFKTVVPHPGLDIDAAPGAPFRAVFDGTVLYAAWLHGYGLTVIVEHGHDLVSIYAHASVITVEGGERVGRGQSLGRVGDTGSLRGPYLYFELRDRGKPVDPKTWLRPR